MILLGSLLGVVLLGCSHGPTGPIEPYVPVQGPQIPDTPAAPVVLPAQAFLDRRANVATGYTTAELDQIARCRVAVFQLRMILTDGGAATVAALRARNPDIVIIGILQVLAVPELWNDPNQRSRFPMGGDLYDLLRMHKARSTAGELLLAWAGMPMVNPAGKLGEIYDRRLLDRVLDVVATHANRYPTAIDGVFHDFLSPSPWPYPRPDAYAGLADFDGDGVDWTSDPDDLNAWTGWQRALVTEFQRRFGRGLIQIGNGKMPHTDPIVARGLSGIAYETFPDMRWGLSLRDGVDRVLAHTAPGYLTPVRGRLWSLVWDHDGGGALDPYRITSMLAGQFYALTDGFGFPGLDPVVIDAGNPLGPATRTTLPDGSVVFQRAFERGEAVIETNSAGGETRIAWQIP